MRAISEQPYNETLGRLLTEQEAGAFLGISFRTLQAWRVQGVGPNFCKIGRMVRYRLTDLVRWTDGQTRASTSDVAAPR